MRPNPKKIRGHGRRGKGQRRGFRRSISAMLDHEQKLKKEITKNMANLDILENKLHEFYILGNDPVLVNALEKFIDKEVALHNSNIHAYNKNEEKYKESLETFEKLWKMELQMVSSHRFVIFNSDGSFANKTEEEFAKWYTRNQENVRYCLSSCPAEYTRTDWWNYPPPDKFYAPIITKLKN